MMHDFALTAEHVVFMDLPMVFNLDVALKGDGDMPYRWDDSYADRFGVMRRDDPFGTVRWFDIDPCYVFHLANAFDATTVNGNSIVLQAVRYPSLWRDSGGFDADGVLWSWTIDLQTGRVIERQLDDRAIEFPRIDDRLATCRPATRCRSVTADWCATTWPAATRSNTPSAAHSRLADPARLCSYRQPQGRPTRVAAGSTGSSSTPSAPAAPPPTM